MKAYTPLSRRVRNGFTLIEVMIAVSLFAIIVGGTISVYIMCQSVWHSTSLKIQTTRDANMAMARIVYGVETNNGLRSAASISVDTNMQGVWVGTDYPPAANASTHSISSGTPDGSWRLTFSNSFDGIHWIDYNLCASNIVFWSDIGNSSSRKLICNYAISATASNTTQGVFITIRLAQRDGNFSATNQVSTFVRMRNN